MFVERVNFLTVRFIFWYFVRYYNQIRKTYPGCGSDQTQLVFLEKYKPNQSLIILLSAGSNIFIVFEECFISRNINMFMNIFIKININAVHVNCEQVWNIVLLFLLLTMSTYVLKSVQIGMK